MENEENNAQNGQSAGEKMNEAFKSASDAAGQAAEKLANSEAYKKASAAAGAAAEKVANSEAYKKFASSQIGQKAAKFGMGKVAAIAVAVVLVLALVSGGGNKGKKAAKLAKQSAQLAAKGETEKAEKLMEKAEELAEKFSAKDMKQYIKLVGEYGSDVVDSLGLEDESGAANSSSKKKVAKKIKKVKAKEDVKSEDLADLGWTFELLDDKTTKISYDGDSDVALAVPAKVDGIPVSDVCIERSAVVTISPKLNTCKYFYIGYLDYLDMDSKNLTAFMRSNPDCKIHLRQLRLDSPLTVPKEYTAVQKFEEGEWSYSRYLTICFDKDKLGEVVFEKGIEHVCVNLYEIKSIELPDTVKDLRSAEPTKGGKYREGGKYLESDIDTSHLSPKYQLRIKELTKEDK